MKQWLRDLALIAVAYLLASRLGQLLAVPPTYATVVWPASGIALAGLLLRGYRVWPGLFLGATLANAWISVFAAESPNAVMSAFLLAAFIAVGATLQAVLGVFLIKRIVGWSNALTHDRDIWGFLTLGGPVACVLGATWGVASLHIAGIIDAGQLAKNWWTWWIGDVIGVIVFTPLSLIVLAKPRTAWRPRLLSVALPLSSAFVATTLGFVYARFSEQADAQHVFEIRAARVVRQIQEQIAGHLDVVHSLESFYASSQVVERSEFETFNRHILTRHPAVQAIEWLPRVSHAQRAEYEAQARSAGLAGYEFTELGKDGQLVTAAERDEYFPVFFVEPRLGNERAIGLDLASNLQRRTALTKSRDTGQPVATGPITLVQETGHQTSVLVFEPVYSRDSAALTVTDRRRALRGFVLGVFRVGDIVQSALPDASERDFNFSITDESAPLGQRMLYDDERESSGEASQVTSMLSRRIGWSTASRIADRQWRFDFSPTPDFFAERENRDTWLILVTGLCFTGLLGTFLMILTGRTARVEDVVLARTRDLSTSNKELAREIVIRRQFEEDLSRAREELEHRVQERTAELQASESRYLDLYDNAPDMFVTFDVATQSVIECNQTFLAVTGYTKAEIIQRSIYDLYHPDCLEDARRAFARFLKVGKMKDFELLLLCADGDVVEASMNVSAVRDQLGRLLYSRAVLRDITAKKHAEARIKAQEIELAHVSRLSTMGEMAAGLAHEINQPLAAIAAYAEGASMRIRNGVVDTVRLADVVDRIAADAHRAGAVIRRLRRFVRKREPDRVEVDMNEMVRDVVQFIDDDAKQREVVIKCELADDLPLVLGDAIEFQQVLLNLARNGCDAMADTEPARRGLIIRTFSTGGDAVEIDVEDQGHGLPESMDEQVFEAFFTSKEDGLGMGLAISRSIIESHGGRIWATPNLEHGATFHFRLPACAEVLIDD